MFCYQEMIPLHVLVFTACIGCVYYQEMIPMCLCLQHVIDVILGNDSPVLVFTACIGCVYYQEMIPLCLCPQHVIDVILGNDSPVLVSQHDGI